MKLKNPKDFWSGVMFAMVGFAFALVVKWSEYPMGTGARMGAGYFPFVLGIVLGLLGIAIIVESFATVGTPIAKFAWRPLLWVLGAFIVFGVTAQLLGLALAIMLLVILSTYGEKKVAPVELMAYVPVILGVLAFGYAWQLAVITL